MNVEELVRQVDADAEALGWDQPERVWEVKGTEDDPYLVLIDIGHNPLMLALTGKLDIEHCLGIVVCSEAWRHLRFEEAQVNGPFRDGLDSMRLKLDMLNLLGAGIDVEGTMQNAWDAFCVETPLSMVKPEFRRETRLVFATTVSGTIVTLNHDRAGDVDVITAKVDEDLNEIPRALTCLLTMEPKAPQQETGS